MSIKIGYFAAMAITGYVEMEVDEATGEVQCRLAKNNMTLTTNGMAILPANTTVEDDAMKAFADIAKLYAMECSTESLRQAQVKAKEDPPEDNGVNVFSSGGKA